MRINNYISTVLVIFIAALTSCGNSKPKSEPEEVLPEDIVELRADQISLAHIETGSVEKRVLYADLKVNGLVTVAPQNLASVSLPIGGFVRNISIMPGCPVRKGQPLAELESQEFIDMQQAYLEAKYKLEFAEAEYKRHSDLYQNEVYSEKSVQEATSEYKSLKANVRALEQKLSLMGIDPAKLNEDNIYRTIPVTSPIAGFIKAVNVNAGKFVGPADVIFEIENRDNLLLELTLFEKDADKAETGRAIEFYINNESEVHKAVINQPGKSVGQDKTIKVYASVIDPCKNILPGMYVNALIEEAGVEAVCLPSDAIVTFDDKDYIFVFEKEKNENGNMMTEFRMINVSRGISDEGFTQVIFPGNLNIQNARVVIKGAYTLLAAKKNAGEMAC